MRQTNKVMASTEHGNKRKWEGVSFCLLMIQPSLQIQMKSGKIIQSQYLEGCLREESLKRLRQTKVMRCSGV